MFQNLNFLAQVFHMGGLGGIPFTGKTGFAAFSHHVPDGKSHNMVVRFCISLFFIRFFQAATFLSSSRRTSGSVTPASWESIHAEDRSTVTAQLAELLVVP